MPYADFAQTPVSTKVAVVTGAAQGIGKETAELLARKGYSLVLCDLQNCRPVSDNIVAMGQQAIEVLGDLAAEETAQEIARITREKFGRANVLVNNAGISHICPAEQTSAADWRRVLDVNLLGPFLLSREIGRMMLAQGSGSIVNVASIAGLLGVADRAGLQREQARFDRLNSYGSRRSGAVAACAATRSVRAGSKPPWMLRHKPPVFTAMPILKREYPWAGSLLRMTSHLPSPF